MEWIVIIDFNKYIRSFYDFQSIRVLVAFWLLAPVSKVTNDSSKRIKDISYKQDAALVSMLFLQENHMLGYFFHLIRETTKIIF